MGKQIQTIVAAAVATAAPTTIAGAVATAIAGAAVATAVATAAAGAAPTAIAATAAAAIAAGGGSCCQYNMLFGGRLQLLAAFATLSSRLGCLLFFLESPAFRLGKLGPFWWNH